ncbi:hypothetical protein OE88DRAFT_810227 [Heliocybe sulcata]|uniref:Uncharacterized protein n=1 Tax=Heliocybe sulcata TaxID=5364 RepID=A0A5C3MQH6_9AGAM|nr:hypothetical protein OE88DRAFT_810227 [Heliocybe sulcata]
MNDIHTTSSDSSRTQDPSTPQESSGLSSPHMEVEEPDFSAPLFALDGSDCSCPDSWLSEGNAQNEASTASLDQPQQQLSMGSYEGLMSIDGETQIASVSPLSPNTRDSSAPDDWPATDVAAHAPALEPCTICPTQLLQQLPPASYGSLTLTAVDYQNPLGDPYAPATTAESSSATYMNSTYEAPNQYSQGMYQEAVLSALAASLASGAFSLDDLNFLGVIQGTDTSATSLLLLSLQMLQTGYRLGYAAASQRELDEAQTWVNFEGIDPEA